MKKSLSILILSLFLASCSIWTKNTMEENKNENNSTINQETNTWVKEETNSWNIAENETSENEVNIEKSNSWTKEETNSWNTEEVKTTDTNESPKTTNEDEKALEAEVNGLLDEFIDSLDNYDK